LAFLLLLLAFVASVVNLVSPRMIVGGPEIGRLVAEESSNVPGADPAPPVLSQVYFDQSPIDCARYSLCRKTAPVLVAMSFAAFVLGLGLVIAVLVWHVRRGRGWREALTAQ
jgi:hypothetical protein